MELVTSRAQKKPQSLGLEGWAYCALSLGEAVGKDSRNKMAYGKPSPFKFLRSIYSTNPPFERLPHRSGGSVGKELPSS